MCVILDQCHVFQSAGEREAKKEGAKGKLHLHMGPVEDVPRKENLGTITLPGGALKTKPDAAINSEKIFMGEAAPTHVE